MSTNPYWGEWPAWLDTATEKPACTGHDTNLFFPSPSRGGATVDQVAKAKAICQSCPLLAECRAWALVQSPEKLDGIWGGTTHSERRRRADRPRGVQPPQFRKTTTSTTTRSA